MTQQEIFGRTAAWVTPGPCCPYPLIRKEFDLPKLRKATITITGLGNFFLFLNGRRVSDDLFLPLYTDYEPCTRMTDLPFANVHIDRIEREQLNHRVLCLEWDVTDYLSAGKNCIGIRLAQMWYVNYSDELKCCFRLSYEAEDGTTGEIVSDDGLLFHGSEIVDGDLWHGESFDFRCLCPGWDMPGYPTDGWTAVKRIDPPETEFYIQSTPSDRVIRTLPMRLIKKTDTYAVYDIGENITGVPVFSATLADGESATVTMTERIDENCDVLRVLPNGRLVAPQVNTYIGNGEEQVLTTVFTWQGFRYIEAPLSLTPVEVRVIHADVGMRAEFACSDEVLNWLWDAFCRSMLTNMHGGIPSDCPHYERRGYTGDGQVTAEASMLAFEAEGFYRKWIDDISDCQDRLSGHVQYTAPYNDAGGGPGGWGSAIVTVPYVFYRQYGDKEPLERMLPQMLRYLDFLEDHSENDLVISDVEGAWCLGEWAIPLCVRAADIKLPPPFVNTYFYIRSMQRILEIARIIGKEEAVSHLHGLIERKKQALIENYYDPMSGNFADNAHSANVFALDIGLGNERTMKNLVADAKAVGRYDAGIFGIELLTKILLERGEEDLAFALLTSHHELSFRRMMEDGATTLWEHFDGSRSHNHPMFGGLVRHFFLRILGIDQPEGAGGYRDAVLLAPVFPKGLANARGSLNTPNGRIYVEWEHKDGSVVYTVDLPEGVDATLKYHDCDIRITPGKNTFFL